MNRKRPHFDRPYREVVDCHDLNHDGCLITKVGMAIPDRYLQAWEKALAWLPRTDGWTQPFHHAVANLINGVRPILYGWPSRQLDKVISEHGLDYLDLGWIKIAFLSGNRDLAELMAWGHGQVTEIKHVVNGVVLAYPLSAIETWVVTGCPGLTMEEVIESNEAEIFNSDLYL